MHFLIPLVSSRYSVLTSFGADLFNALKAIGCEATLFIENNATPEGVVNDLASIVRDKKITHILSFNGAVFDLCGQDQFPNVTFIAWMVDYPAYHYPRLSNRLAKTCVVSANEDHRYYINDITTARFLCALLPGASKRHIYPDSHIRQRPFDVVMVGSWMGEPVPFWEDKKTEFERKVIQEIVDESIQSEVADVYLSVKRVFEKHQIARDTDPAGVSALINSINDYLRRYTRLKMMVAIASSGLKSLIVGEGWEKDFNFPQLNFHASAQYQHMPTIYENAKVAINLNSNSGASERALQALASGCHVFSFHGKSMQHIADQGHSVWLQNSSLPVSEIATALKQCVEKANADGAQEEFHHELKEWPVVARILVQQLLNDS